MGKKVEPAPSNWQPAEFPEPAPAEVLTKVTKEWLSLNDDATAFNPKQYQAVLTPLDIPRYVKPPDRTGQVGHWSPVPGGDPRDHLTDLTVAQRAELLAQNGVYLSKKQVDATDNSGLGAMHAYVVGDDLHPSLKYAVRLKKVTLEPPSTKRKDNVVYSYNEFESDLQRHLISENELSAGIPKLFKATASYGYASASAAHESTVSVYFTANEWVAKAHVILDKKDITLDPEFVQAVKDACSTGKSTHLKAKALLAVLKEYGQFVPLGIMLGGRISLSETTKLSDKRTFEAVKHKFGLAADARFKIRGVPVEGGGGTTNAIWHTDDQKVISQAKTLTLELKGGDQRLASTDPLVFGTMWLNSLGLYKEWGTFGFTENSLVPIIDFLPADLSKECEALLRAYFLENLDARETRGAGHLGGTEFADKDFKYTGGKNFPSEFKSELKTNVRGFHQIIVNAEGNIDGLKLTYSVYYGAGSGTSYPTTYVSGTFGKMRSGHDWRPIDFERGEEIAALEVWVDKKDPKKPVLKQLAIRTNRDRRFPNDKDFYGTNHEPYYTFDIIEAPRVRVLRARSGEYIHSLSLTYLNLAGNADSRNFLLAMEPILFPTGDYGPLAK